MAWVPLVYSLHRKYSFIQMLPYPIARVPKATVHLLCHTETLEMLWPRIGEVHSEMSDGWTIEKATGASTFNNSSRSISSYSYGIKSMNAFKTHFFRRSRLLLLLLVPLLFLWVAISLTTTQWTDYKHKNIYMFACTYVSQSLENFPRVY